MKKPIAVAISGGVDSLVAAHLLKQQGYRVFGIHFITGYETGYSSLLTNPNQPADNIKEIYTIANQRLSRLSQSLKIPIEVIDCSAQFKHRVVDYFTDTYKSGKTPNPCMVCNPVIKFGTVLSRARDMGASQLASGHYACKKGDRRHGFNLLKGIDAQKDQSYFLSRMTQGQLGLVRFPLGEMTKSQVVDYAANNGLKPLTPGESQDICFIRNTRYTEFLASQNKWKSAPGPIENVRGNFLGTHNGLYHFTVGQRKGINCPGPEPYYVVKLDTEHNRLVVGGKNDLLCKGFEATHINWIHAPPIASANIDVKIRYRHKPIPALINFTDEQSVFVQFIEPQFSVTPGQGAVFYRDAEVLGGGWINNNTNHLI